MDPATAELWRTHIENCERCSRYDRVLRRGLNVLATQPLLQLDSQFNTQLHRKLAFEDRRFATRPITSLATAYVAVAAMLAFAAWLPVLMLSRNAEPPAAVQQASQVASEIAWHGESAVQTRTTSHVHQARRVVWPAQNSHQAIEPKYTPVSIESPIAPLSYARTVSYDSD